MQRFETCRVRMKNGSDLSTEPPIEDSPWVVSDAADNNYLDSLGDDEDDFGDYDFGDDFEDENEGR